MIDLADALVDRGYFVHQLFVGDPKLPAREERSEGRLVLERWSQWISVFHQRDVYDGEDGKWRDFSRTVPPHVADLVAASASELCSASNAMVCCALSGGTSQKTGKSPTIDLASFSKVRSTSCGKNISS